MAENSQNDNLNRRTTEYPIKSDRQVVKKRNSSVQYSDEANRLQSIMACQFTSVDSGPNYDKLQSKSDENKKYLEQKKKQYEDEQRKKSFQKLSETESKEKAIYVRELKAFLRQDSSMLLPKFFVINDESDFMKSLMSKTGLSDVTGVYVICNITKRKCYVGKHINAFNASWQLFRPREDSKNHIADLKNDYDDGDKMAINFIRLKDTDFDTLDELEAFHIARYGACQNGYNSNVGSKPKRHWYSYQ